MFTDNITAINKTRVIINISIQEISAPNYQKNYYKNNIPTYYFLLPVRLSSSRARKKIRARALKSSIGSALIYIVYFAINAARDN